TLSVAQPMRERKRSVMIPAYSRQRRGIVIRRFLGRVVVKRRGSQQRIGAKRTARQRPSHTDSNAIQKIAPRKRAMHPQFAILLLFTHAQNCSADTPLRAL